MKRHLALALSFTAMATGLFLGSSPEAQSQAAGIKPTNPTDELIETADGVKLRGLFYPAAVNKNGSCVIIMHQLYKDPTKGDWDGLAKRLTTEGFNVLRFDFRGHGKSTDLIPEKFAQEPLNQTIPGVKKTIPKRELTLKDIEKRSGYAPQMIYDIAAARNHLDKLNDDGQVNTSSVYLIGAGDSASLGFLFLASEWHREQKKPGNIGILAPKTFISATSLIAPNSSPAGRDYGGCVWLSAARHSDISRAALERAVSTIGRHSDGDMRKETPMLFIHGEKDTAGAANAKLFLDQIMIAGGRKSSGLAPLDSTYVRTIKGSNLTGVDLLGKDETLGTEKLIVEFLNKMEEDRRKKPRIQREYSEPMRMDIRSFVGG